MRKMYSKNQIATIAKEQVEENVVESLKDKDIQVETIWQDTPNLSVDLVLNDTLFTTTGTPYLKVVQYGNFLNIIACANSLKALSNTAFEDAIFTFELPKAIADKVITINGGAPGVVSSTLSSGNVTFAWNGNKMAMQLIKLDDTHFKIAHIGSWTADDTIYSFSYRMQLILQ